MKYAPVALFVYKRPRHTKETIKALLANKGIEETELFIFSDAARNEKDISEVNAVREYIKQVKGVKKLYIFEQHENKGLASSIIEGVTSLTTQYGRIIVLEDDLITSPFFLTYMNKALELYKDAEQVMHISAYLPPLNKKLPPTFFYNQASCWGWGTWARAWDKFSNDVPALIEKINVNGGPDAFNMEGTHDFMHQLQQNANGIINTWAIKWQAAVFLNKGLCLHPHKSLIQNNGLDWSGEHTGPMPGLLHKELATYIKIAPIETIPSRKAFQAIASFHKKMWRKPTLFSKIVAKIKRRLFV